MTGTLALTAAAMGLAATPHCATMCAALCAAGSRCSSVESGDDAPAARGSVWHRTAPMLAGRLAGYSVAGALAALFYENLSRLGESMTWLRPFWGMTQLFLLGLGLLLVVRGAFPRAVVAWVESWRRAAVTPSAVGVEGRGALRRFLLALLWPAIPCGVLQAALLVAALSSSPLEGALVMLSFGLASLPGLLLGRGVWERLGRAWSRQGAQELSAALPDGARPVRFAPRVGTPAWGETVPLRLAGLVLASTAAWWFFGPHWDAVRAWCA